MKNKIISILLLGISLLALSCSNSENSISNNGASNKEILANLNGKTISTNSSKQLNTPSSSSNNANTSTTSRLTPNSKQPLFSSNSSYNANSYCYSLAPQTATSFDSSLDKRFYYTDTFDLDPTDTLEYEIIYYSNTTQNNSANVYYYTNYYYEPTTCLLKYKEELYFSTNILVNPGDTDFDKTRAYNQNDVLIDSYISHCEKLTSDATQCTTSFDNLYYAYSVTVNITELSSTTEKASLVGEIYYPTRNSWTEKFELLDYGATFETNQTDRSKTITNTTSELKITIIYNNQDYTYYGAILRAFDDYDAANPPSMILYATSDKQLIEGKIIFNQNYEMTVYYFDSISNDYKLAQ